MLLRQILGQPFVTFTLPVFSLSRTPKRRRTDRRTGGAGDVFQPPRRVGLPAQNPSKFASLGLADLPRFSALSEFAVQLMGVALRNWSLEAVMSG
jgi:hypothetical protein